jgi:large subunit ribosomal protein L21
MAKGSKNTAADTLAVIKTGGKQYLVAPGQTITVEKLGDDLKQGDSVNFDVLMTVKGDTVTVGTPSVSGAKVAGTFVENGRGKKLVVMKYKAKSRYMKKNGHRQPFSKVKIESIA